MPQVSLVIVVHEMARELPRTITSLTAPYQHGMDGRDEIIVVDNGSREPPLQAAFAGLVPPVRVIRQPAPTASPVPAINTGLAAAAGALIGVWIDGARLASPGLVAAARAAARLHPRAVIATPNFQLGPQLQYLAAERGYDPAAEDRLLDGIGWPADGYRLFDVATPEARDGPAGPLRESNALFLPRPLWDELGGYDPVFDEPGGGAANPDALVRACGLADAQLIRIVGEGTFHQIHGGLTTSTSAGALRTVQDAGRAYLRRRGRPAALIREPGWLFDARAGRLCGTISAHPALATADELR